MAAVHAQAHVQAASLKSADGKVVLDDRPGLACFTEWYGALQSSGTDEPPRKKARLDLEDKDTSSTSVLPRIDIPIAQISLDLKDEDGDLQVLPSFRGVGDEYMAPDLRIGLIKAERNWKSKDIVELTLAPQAGSRRRNQMTLSISNGISAETFDDLVRFAALERKIRGQSKTGVARCSCALYRNKTTELGRSQAYTLDLRMVWPEGVATLGPSYSSKPLDWEILMRYYPENGVDVTKETVRERNRRFAAIEEWSPKEFYDSVYAPASDAPVDALVDTGFLETELYPFQKRAISWMLAREGKSIDVDVQHEKDVKDEEMVLDEPKVDSSQFIPPLSYTRTVDAHGGECFVSHLQLTIATRSFLKRLRGPLGGILAEEMGLGKTVELISLLCLHKRSESKAVMADESLIPSAATLIVTPATILEQWKAELSKHAPHLEWLHYQGVGSLGKKSGQTEDTILDSFTTKDVVLTTYNVLAKEVHFAVDPPERSRRREPQNPRKRSPLVQVQWWRVCLDEAQMVENGVSAAAKVAALIPRVNAWAISGTPLKKDVQDLRGLLIFLRYYPYSVSVDVWTRLVEYHKEEFKRLFRGLALRHTKDQIRHELRLPPQRRVVITVPFTTVEEQNYRNLFEEMAEDCGCALDGSPLHGLWDPNEPRTAEAMRTWLVRLRQTCLHPQVGGRNRRALGRGAGPLRTVAEVLEVMIDQNETGIRTESRSALQSLLLRGHIIGNAKSEETRAEQALKLYEEALKQAEAMVEECRNDLALAGGVEEERNLAIDDEETPERSRQGKLRANLRLAIQLQHACLFFIGTAYFQIKSNSNLTKEDTDKFRDLEQNEVLHYDKAKLVRNELLKQNMSTTEKLMRSIEERQTVDRLAKAPFASLLKVSGGIENRRLVTKMHQLAHLLSAQANVMKKWRAKVTELSLKPLVDKDEGIETTGDEYEHSTQQQDELSVYIDALALIVSDRSTCLTGQVSDLAKTDHRLMLRNAKAGDGHAPALTIELLGQRDDIKQRDDDIISIRGLVNEARSTESALQWQRGQSTRIDSELRIVGDILRQLQTTFDFENKAMTQLEEDLELYRSTMNHRVEFYRQLQVISDEVTPYKEELDEELDVAKLESTTQQHEKQVKSLAALKTKHRFLLHLRDESQSEAQRICVICQSGFEQGVLTICGHQYCKECIQHWWSQHRTCPVCKRRLNSADFHQITYKPQEIRAQEETRSDPSSPDLSEVGSSGNNKTASIYTDMATSTMNEIKSVDLPGSFGTKIDTLARHIIWLRTNDPGAKCIVFSQYRDFLSVLSSAFTSFGIAHTRMGSPNAIDRFRTDASIECFLLDAKTDSSGLNLVNAQHVFLCEPLINTAIELQAIARVHRIGQQRATTVYMYLIRDTVEEAIYEISVQRRLAHLQRNSNTTKEHKSRSATPALGETAIDAANSMEMQAAPLSKLLVQGKGGGELVSNDDLWACLFGKPQQRQAGTATTTGGNGLALEAAVGRHLRAEAALGRAVAGAASL